VKRTLKRESKVLEIVRREAIGVGDSLPCLPFSGRRAGEARPWSALAPRSVSTRAAPVHSALASEPASALAAADGPGGGPGGLASRPCPPGATPGVRSPLGLRNPARALRGKATRRRGARRCGDREPMPAPSVRPSRRESVSGLARDAGTTALIVPS
jgi:hypothetical protein